VEKYLHDGPVRTPDPKQRWLTFVHNHAKVIVACDFFVVITATFRTLYVFVILELATRRILHHNVWVANSRNHATIGVWYNPRQCFCQRYEAKLIGDAGPPESGVNNVPLRYTSGLPEENRHGQKSTRHGKWLIPL
jgi:hypothetical protein